MEASHPISYGELACSKVVELVVRVNKERCGQLLRYCPLCSVTNESAEFLLEHLRSHLETSVNTIFYSAATSCDQVSFHSRFPELMGTTCTDNKLSAQLEILGKKTGITPGGLKFQVLAVEVRARGLQFLFCTLCGHGTTTDVSLQEKHFFETHVALREITTKSFRHFIPL